MPERVIDRGDVTVRDVLQEAFNRYDYEIDVEVLKCMLERKSNRKILKYSVLLTFQKYNCEDIEFIDIKCIYIFGVFRFHSYFSLKFCRIRRNVIWIYVDNKFIECNRIEENILIINIILP